MKRFILSAMAVGMFAVGANAACSETVVIGNVSDLNAFRNRVNGAEDGSVEKALCAVLTSDITYTEGSASNNNWNPIKMYEGTFDGQGHTISGLYYTAPLSSETDGENTVKNSYFDAGFFANLAGSAVVKNLHITGATFAADERAGGIVADVKTGASVILENVSFSGTITSVTTTSNNSLNGHFGGLIGTVSSGAVSVSLKNCYSDGTVTTAGSVESYTSGGLIGSVFGDNTEVTIFNCYSAGSVSNVASGGHSGMIIAQNSATSVDMRKVYCSSNTSSTASFANCESTTTKADAESNFAGNLASQKSDGVDSYNSSAKGVTFSYDSETKKLSATINSAATEFSLPQDVFVDQVVLDRVFTAGAYSTIMLPFSVAVGSVAGASEFATFTGVTKNAEGTAYTTVTGSKVTNNLAAHTPYLLKTSGTTLTVSGAVTLKANVANTTTKVGDWSFIGTTAKKRWQNVCTTDASKCENAAEIGKVYGFSGSKVGDIEIGNFVKVGNKVAISPMRAYLMYTGSENLPVAKGKPAAPGMAMAAAVESVPTVILPDTMKVIIVDPVVEDPEEDVPSEGPLALDPIKAPAAAFKADRWYDITGRNLNKPKAQGAYINNRTTVIAK